MTGTSGKDLLLILLDTANIICRFMLHTQTVLDPHIVLSQLWSCGFKTISIQTLTKKGSSSLVCY